MQLIKERVRKNIPNFFILIVSLIIFLLLLEGVVRMLNISSGYDYPPGLFQEDDLLDYKMTPNFSGKFIKQEFEADISTNSYGLRDVEYSGKEDFKILALGDSFVWGGYGTSLEQTFVKVLENKLNKNSNKKYSVINAGVIGYELDQELLYLEDRGYKFEPDLVLLNFFVGNDFTESGNVTVKDGILITYKSNSKRIRSYLLRNFYSYRLIENGLINIFENFIQKNIMGKVQNDEYESKLFLKESDHEMNEQIIRTEQLLDEMNDYLSSKKTNFVVVLIPLKYQVDDKLEQIFIENNYDDEEIDMKQPQKIIKDWGENRGVKVIDLLPELKELNEDNDFYWELNPHFNFKGNEIVGEIIYKELGDKNLI